MSSYKKCSMQIRAMILLYAMLIFSLAWVAPVHAQDKSSDSNEPFPPILWDYEPPSPKVPSVNPYIFSASMNSWSKPILNHKGEPHDPGDVVEIIVDGGKGIQDPPNPDGTPGGDDSLAYGNFNMIRVAPPEDCPDGSGRKGMFYSQRYFIPFVPPTRAYYLRLWEGKSIAEAQYYQDTIEYDAGDDRGGGMVFLRTNIPMDIDWTFGPSQPRPKSDGKKS